MKKITKWRFINVLAAAVFAVTILATAHGFAANNTNLTQTINAGTLTTDIRDASRVTVGSPSVAMSAQTFSFDCETTTGTLGTNTQRLYVDNPDAADNGWTLTIAATGGNTTRWQNGGASAFIDFNDPTSSGCSDGGDADSSSGQMTIDASVGTLTADCGSCANTNISLGSTASFNQGTTDSITLLNAASNSADIWRGYLINASVSQKIPAETAADSFTINLTLTATAQ